MANTERYSRSINTLYKLGMGMRPDRNSRTGKASAEVADT